MKISAAAVYQSERWGVFTYTVPNLTPGGTYTVRLHFAEIAFASAGARLFSVAINGSTVLNNFDIFATAGGANKALVEQFTSTADATGKITIAYQQGLADQPKSSGIEIIPAVGTPPATLQINSGGGAVGSWLADEDFNGGSTSTVTATINTSGVTNPAPAAVYQSERWGVFTYTVPNLTPGSTYTVRLHFAEIAFANAGARLFNVAINGSTVLSNFDIFATAGGANKALVEQFTSTADTTGKITISYIQGSADQPKSSGIEIIAASPPPALLQVSSGGGGVSTWVPDQDFSGGSTSSVTATINISGVINPAPTTVYQNERWGVFTYTIPSLVAGHVYTVRLHFAEIAFTSAGARLFSVAINGSTALSNFDIFATAGGANKALVEQFTSTADATGKITIAYQQGLADQPKSSGIEIIPAVGTPPATLQINSGGGTVGSWLADEDFSGGSTSSTTATINTSGVTNPAPAAVYQSERWGVFTYTVPNLTPGGTYTVRLHFAEIAFA